MPKLETIPVEEANTLLQKPPASRLKGIVAAAAVASFVIGALAATAVDMQAGRHVSELAKHGDLQHPHQPRIFEGRQVPHGQERRRTVVCLDGRRRGGHGTNGPHFWR